MFRRVASRPLIAALAMLVIGSFGGDSAAAQIDYRNLDEGRPVRTEDAYPVERYAFELVLPYQYENERGPGRSHFVAPELAYGILANTMVGLKLPFAALDGGPGVETRWGFGGPRIFALYNFNTESRRLPALALRVDASLPLGNLAGDQARGAFTAIATRSWGRTRAHLNATAGFGPGFNTQDEPPAHAIPAWSASAAIDHTLLRRSVVVIGEIALGEAAGESDTEVSVALGGRMQLTPTFVLDAGIERRLTNRAGADIGLTIGISHAFALAGLMPAGSQ